MRSLSADVVPWAQHDPQYWGMCWFLSHVAYDSPSMSRMSHESGTSASA